MPARLPDHLRRSSAQRASEWRAARRAAGIVPTRGKSGRSAKKERLFDRAEFVAVDGEGFTEGDPQTIEMDGGARYTFRAHYYALLSASDGSEAYAPKGRLKAKECLDFLLAIMQRNPRAVLVCFGGSYDMTQMLVHGVPRRLLAKLLEDDAHIDVTMGGHDYRLHLRPRKSLTVRRWPKGAAKKERGKAKRDGSPGKWQYTPHDKATLWDVLGFFQERFTETMRKWLPDDPDRQMIVEKKGERAIFDRAEIDAIRIYNQAECRCLARIMDKVRDALRALGIALTRWDGAGAVAGAMMKLHGVKDHMAPSPPEVFMAARHAYSGGHIEACQLGHHDGPVHHYDINSAYPSVFAGLPSLAHGRWVHGSGAHPPPGFTVVRTIWRFRWGNSFYPLFYREETGAIRYPCDGHGWHWFPEWEAAREYVERFGAERFNVQEWWHFEPDPDAPLPFGWVRDYYARRQELARQVKAGGIDTGEEKVIKLALNSLYGKTAQQLGWRIDEDGELHIPSYFQLEWAGFVTAGCRGKLMMAALHDMTGIISFATDGLFSTTPLPLDCPAEKVLGLWEAQVHDGLTMVMPGVYWLHDGEKVKHYSRGFDKERMTDAEFVIVAWRKRQKAVPVELTRLIGISTAVTSKALWAARGTFATGTRRLALNGDNAKRVPAALYACKPWQGLVPLTPRDRDDHGDFHDQYQPRLSEAYSIAWLETEDDAPDEAEREAIDAEHA